MSVGGMRRRSSVTEHGFGSSEPYTVGIEEEYMLLDAGTLDLVQRADTILDAGRDGELALLTSCEIFQSEIEGHTPICGTVAEAASELPRLRAVLARAVGDAGLVLASSGTHPFARYEDQVVTDTARYRGIVEQLQYPARRELIFGLHVHVGVPDPEAAIRALRGLRAHLGTLVALSASSPFWRGFASGLRSTRHSVFATFPRSGVPPAFRDYAEFAAFVGSLEEAGVLEDYTRIWWDVRPHPRLGTIEVRATDAVPRVDDAVALAALVRALVRQAVESRPAPPTALEDAIVRENKWQAIRHGLDGRAVAADGRWLPLREHVLRTLDGLDCEEAHAVERIVREGTGADRQLATYAETHDLRAVTRSIAAETSAQRTSSTTAPRRSPRRSRSSASPARSSG